MSWHSPDGLSPEDIDNLPGEAAEQSGPHPTTALLDGTALARRERRETQRLLGATVRVLRVHGGNRRAQSPHETCVLDGGVPGNGKSVALRTA